MRLQAALVLSVVVTISIAQGQILGNPVSPPDFTYENNGAAAWPQKYQTCGGKNQSPVEISAGAAINKTNFPPLVWTDYIDVQRTYALLNNWQGVQLMIPPGSQEAKIKGGPLTAEYTLSHIAFKWGNELGSEHSIDKYYYGMEAQLVHYKKSNTNLDDAMKDPEGFTIVSVLFMINQQNITKELEPIVSNLKNSATGGTIQNISGNNVLSWLQKYISTDCRCTKTAYYTYVGSLTTPPCNENVVWIVMANPLMVGITQLKEFQKIKGVADVTITENKRPAQSMNNRKLQYKSEASDLHNSFLLMAMAMFLAQDSNKILLG